MIHANPRYKDREALAPYNFVSLPDKVRLVEWQTNQNVYESDRYTGEFVCSLTTETPIFIRGPLPSKDFQNGVESKNKPDFFSVSDDKTPRIPASSLRGLLRHTVAIVSNARMNNVTDQQFAFRAVDTTKLGQQYRARIMREDEKNWFTPLMRGGYVRQKDGEWYIQPAQEIGGATWCRISHRSIPDELQAWPSDGMKHECGVKNCPPSKNARVIYIQPGAFEYQDVRGGFLRIKSASALRASGSPAPGLREAALAPSGEMLSKRSEAIVFPPDPQKEWLPMRFTKKTTQQKVAVDKVYRDQITDSQRALLGLDGALKELQPVFYLTDEDGDLLFFGHTRMFRIPYKKSPHDLIPADLREEKSQLDLAEALFGTVRAGDDGKNLAVAGRVFFSDGAYVGNLTDPFERVIKPKVLSGPKPTTFQHYVMQPLPNDKEKLQHYDDEDAQIRGDKLYWHKGKISIEDAAESDPNKLKHVSQYTDIKAVKTGVQFSFSIKFENLRLEELGALVWVLQIAADPRYRLKLGMGKPLGMGAVALGFSIRLTDRRARYARLFDEAGAFQDGWQDTAAAPVLCDQAVTAFEKFVAGDSQSFARQKRITELLTLLSWPGPDPARTRYLEIERRDKTGRKINEYKLRPVLPDPMFVVAPKYVGETAPIEIVEQEAPPVSRPTSTARSSITPADIAVPEVRENVSAEAQKLAQSLSAKRFAEGDIVTATVMRVTANDYECQIEGSPRPAKLPRDEVKGLKMGDSIKTRVKRLAGSGAAILTVKGLSKS